MIALLLACSGSSGPGTSDTGSPTALTPSELPTPTADEPARTVQLFGPSARPGLRVELHHRQGAGPTDAAIDKLEDALDVLVASGHIDKPGGIEVVRGTQLPAGDPDAVHTFDALRAELEAVRGPFVDDDATVIHALYTDGSYEDDGPNGTVLGFAWGGARLVMMRDSIDASCDRPGFTLLPGGRANGCATLEGSVLLHELGHLFGLVDNGLPMVTPHRDPDHGAHDDDEDCLMYWAAETNRAADRILDRLTGGNTGLPSFDQACLDDMAAALDTP